MLNLNLLKPNRIIVTISKTVKSEKKGQNSLTSVSWMWIFSGVFLSRWRRSVTPTWWWRGFPTRPPFMRTTSATWPWTCWAPLTTSKTLPPEITSRSESVSRTTVSRDRAHRLFRLLLAVGRPRAQGRPPAAASELAGIQCLDPCSLDFCRLGCLSTQPPPTCHENMILGFCGTREIYLFNHRTPEKRTQIETLIPSCHKGSLF